MWPFQKKENLPLPSVRNPTTTTSEDEFERVVSDAVGPGKKEPEETAPPEESDRLVIHMDWSGKVVNGCFWPLARFDHPAWALTEEETAAIAPKMHVFLQAVSDRYAPAWLGRMATRHAELFDLGIALTMMYYAKFQQVNEARAEAVAAETARQKSPASVVDIATRQPVVGKPEKCEVCGREFANYVEMGRHLPCSGPEVPVA